MDSKTTGIAAYITWIGFILSFIIGAKDDEFVKFHQNQALVILIGQTASALLVFIYVGYLTNVVFFVLWVMGLVNAINNEMKPLPVISEIKLIK